MDALPTIIWVLIVAVVLIDVVALVDLARREVRHLPRWGWALLIVTSFPLGLILYAAIGRVHGPRTDVDREDPDGVPAVPVTTAPVLRERSAPHAGAESPTGDRDDPRRGIISTQGLGKRYDETWALRDVSLFVPEGSVCGLVGPNGAGKTTLLSILAGLRRPTEGTLSVAVDRSAVSVVIDTPQFEPWLTAREVVDMARHLSASDLPVDRVERALEEAGLADAIDRRVGGFSRGMLQRVGLAAALVTGPRLLILDEPSSALDPAGRREVLDLIGSLAQRTTALLSTHILADVQQVCDVVGVIDRGRLRFQGPIEELLARTSTAYSLQVRGDIAALRTQLEAQPWVEDLTQPAPHRLRLVVSDAIAAEQEIPVLVVAAGVALASFTPATDLESAFLELTS